VLVEQLRYKRLSKKRWALQTCDSASRAGPLALADDHIAQ